MKGTNCPGSAWKIKNWKYKQYIQPTIIMHVVFLISFQYNLVNCHVLLTKQIINQLRCTVIKSNFLSTNTKPNTTQTSKRLNGTRCSLILKLLVWMLHLLTNSSNKEFEIVSGSSKCSIHLNGILSNSCHWSAPFSGLLAQ